MIRKENVKLTLDDGFSGRMARAAAAMDALNLSLELMHATWEPHDWSDF